METNRGAEGRRRWSALLEIKRAGNILNCSYNYRMSAYLNQILTNLNVEKKGNLSDCSCDYKKMDSIQPKN